MNGIAFRFVSLAVIPILAALLFLVPLPSSSEAGSCCFVNTVAATPIVAPVVPVVATTFVPVPIAQYSVFPQYQTAAVAVAPPAAAAVPVAATTAQDPILTEIRQLRAEFEALKRGSSSSAVSPATTPSPQPQKEFLGERQPGDGLAILVARCGSCHDKTVGKGDVRFLDGKNLAGDVNTLTLLRVLGSIREHGNQPAAMPKGGSLTKAERDAVADYVDAVVQATTQASAKSPADGKW
jgi:mono/diheme cytochrome c family protein